MKDRIPRYPGRTKVTHADGTVEYVTLERADEPVQVGTPYNKASLLTDATAAKYGKGADALPDQIFSYLGDFMNGGATKIATGSYVGTGTNGATVKITLSFDFKPNVILISPQNAETAGGVFLSNDDYHLLPVIAIRGQETGIKTLAVNGQYGFTYYKDKVSWSDTSFSLWNDTSYSSVSQIMNISGVTYFYVAIGEVS